MSNLVLTPAPIHDPLESWHQETFFYTAELNKAQYPELKFLAAVPNGGYRHKATAQAMKRQGVKKGVPDTFLPVARGGYTGWWGELKRYGGTPSDVSADQKDWLCFLQEQGYRAEWHRGWQAMWNDLVWYLSLPKTVVDFC